MSLRISTTTLEQYRLWSEQDWMPEQDLINNITGVRVETPAMKLGTAWHKVLEDPEPHRVFAGFHCDGFSFPADTMEPALALIDRRRGVFELKSTRDIGGHTIVARADQVVGSRIFEHKTTTNTFDADKYLNSYQWRFECAIFQPSAVTYRVFLLDDPLEGIVRLRSIEQVTTYPYPDLHADCADLVRRFTDYVTARGLTRFLERPTVADAA